MDQFFFNVNNPVWVKLTAKGELIVKAKNLPSHEKDADGYEKWQLWELMNAVGEYLCNGCVVPFLMNIKIDQRNLQSTSTTPAP